MAGCKCTHAWRCSTVSRIGAGSKRGTVALLPLGGIAATDQEQDVHPLDGSARGVWLACEGNNYLLTAFFDETKLIFFKRLVLACQLNAAQYIVSAGVSPQPFRKRLGTNTRDRAVVPAERRIGS